MASQVTEAVYELLRSEDKPFTAAGVCYRLHSAFVPTLVYSEAEMSLEWLYRSGYVSRKADGPMGPEYQVRDTRKTL